MEFSSQFRLIPPLLVSLLIFAYCQQALAATEASVHSERLTGGDIADSALNSCKDPKVAEFWKNALLSAPTSQNKSHPSVQVHFSLVTDGNRADVGSDHDTMQWFRCKLTNITVASKVY